MKTSPIKPRQIISKLDLWAEEIHHPFPPLSIGSPTLIESFLIVALARVIRASSVLEIGTYTGYMSSILAKNVAGLEITTVDFPRSKANLAEPDLDKALVSGEHNDRYLTSLRDLQGTVYLDALGDEPRSRVTEIELDSTSPEMFDLLKLRRFDLCFIDGGHSKETVLSDHELVDLVGSDRSICVWHDYGSSLHPDVKIALDSVGGLGSHFSVEGTSLLISFPEKSHLDLKDVALITD